MKRRIILKQLVEALDKYEQGVLYPGKRDAYLGNSFALSILDKFINIARQAKY